MMKFQPEKGANKRSSIKSIVCRFFSATPSEARAPIVINTFWRHEPIRLSLYGYRGASLRSGFETKAYPCPPRSNFRRIFTKLYGGHGPVYLKFKRSPNFWATLFTAASNSDSRAF